MIPPPLGACAARGGVWAAKGVPESVRPTDAAVAASGHQEVGG